MKSSILVLVLIFASFQPSSPQRSSRNSIPPREHRTLDGELRDYNKDKKPGGNPGTFVPRLTSAQVDKLRENAEQLARLAQSIPAEVDQTTKGVLPKELSAKLRRIEKLAKNLRSSISQ